MIAPENITSLSKTEVFVFGSNENGHHSGGAAKKAMEWGAQWGKPFGLYGSTFAIPTLDKNMNQVSLSQLQKYVCQFIDFAKEQQHLTFLVTEIGCGIAGFKVADIAPLFQDALLVQNIYLPERFYFELE